jgi:hydrogenase maturation protein HypF
MTVSGRRIAVRGVVQGVGFRPWVWRVARDSGVGGRVSNDASGVTIDAFGSAAALETFVTRLRLDPPPAAEIREFTESEIAPETPSSFVIVESRKTGGLSVSIPADLATCADCEREIFDTNDRRYRYPFTNCTNCGPRFTITREVPYDRPATTMASFRMCTACQAEYDDPADRRFHAQPNACPACGPRLTAVDPGGEPLSWLEPIATTARALEAGLIVAIKGIGGFHLACDATSPFAVTRLRQRKRREEKPLAVMVRDIAAAESLAEIGEEERRLLLSPRRPIVLLRQRENSGLVPEVAPESREVGVMLPYTPLHHLLLAEAARPLVMTSGNLSDEPIATGNAEAIERLGAIADTILLHDREIESRCDDSVARVIAGAPTVLRRSRGFVPSAVSVREPFRVPVLACGPHLKNTFCFGLGSSAYFGPHMGDLENLETLEAFEEAVARMERFLRVSPAIIAHDLHPLYLSTRYALGRSEGVKVGIQHHHAHVVSAMAEHGLEGPVIGLAWDGTGWGPDGTAWGGETLFVHEASSERLATFRPVPLAGGDSAIRQVWRVALALVDDAFDGTAQLEALPLFRSIPRNEITVVRQLIRKGVNAPLARGVGRFFDGLGALVLSRAVSRFEGQVAMAWNTVADETERRAYPFDVENETTLPAIDLRPMIRAAVEDLIAGTGAASISGRFHNTLARAAAWLVNRARERAGDLPVVLTGGCFQNALLTERVLAELGPSARVFLHRSVPPGDGGIALGQAVAASAVLSASKGVV